jgi:hypothetical protein
MKYYDPPMDGNLNRPQMLVCTNTNNFETWNSQTLRILFEPISLQSNWHKVFMNDNKPITIFVWIIQHVIEMTKSIMPNTPFSWLGHYK